MVVVKIKYDSTCQVIKRGSIILVAMICEYIQLYTQ